MRMAKVNRAAFASTTTLRASTGRPDTVAFVQGWMLSGDHEPDKWHNDFAAAIDDRSARLEKQNALLRDALKNFMGLLDTPIGRRRHTNDRFYAECIAAGHNALENTDG